MERGQLVGERFEIESLAGSGGMGEVYRARDQLDGEVVGVKVLRDAASTESVARFAREAELLAALRHPAIVRYVAHGIDNARAYLAMEWLEGEDLHTRLAREALTVGETVALGRRVGEALGAAHARGMVHRDLKPANLYLVGGDIRRVKLLDFGVARMAGAYTLTRTGAFIGTPFYVSPEQARGRKDLDARSDVFALGALLHECVSGEPVFAAEVAVAVLARILLEEVAPLSEVVDGVPEALSALITRMLSKDREGRPRDGAEVAAELAALGELPEAAPRAPPREKPPALTSEEQRLLCIVLGRPDALATKSELGNAETLAQAAPPAALEKLASERGAELAFLADGSLLCTLRGDAVGGLAGQAARAGRLAIALREAAPQLLFALATGRVPTGARLPIGEVVERAAALVHGPVGIGVDKTTASLLDERFELAREDGQLTLVGKRKVASRVRTLLGKATPTVGRDRELRILEDYLDECIEEPMGRPVLVTGGAGVGKSRLRYELLRRIAERDEPITVWMGRGDPVSAGSALGLLGRALKQAAGLQDGAPLEERRAQLCAFAGRHLSSEDGQQVAELLGEMLGAPFEDEDSAPLRAARADARLMADRMRLAFEELIIAECGAGPLVLVLEDVQWGDLPTVSFIDGTLRVLGERPWFVLALARPEVHELFPKLWSERDVQELRLGPLRPRAARSLVSAVLGEDTPEPVLERIVGGAEGNAYALEELMQAEAEGQSEGLPDTVLGLAEARLLRLEPEARRLLRAASIFGEVFWAGGVHVLFGNEASDLDEWLDVLAERELITLRSASRFPGEREFAFRHGLVREAAYAMLVGEDRTLGHRLAGNWLEPTGETEALVLAEHWEQGGERARAAAAYLRAARQALEGDDLATALMRAERGAACGAQGELLGDLRLVQAEAHRWRGENVETAERSAEAVELLRDGSRGWLSAARELARAHGLLDQRELVGALAQELLLIEPEADASGAATVALIGVGRMLPDVGLRALAEALFERAEALFERAAAAPDPAAAASLAAGRALRADFSGDPAATLENYFCAAAHHDAAGDRRGLCLDRAHAGYSLFMLGAYSRAEAVLRETLITARRMGLRNVEATALQNLGATLACQGQLREACEAQRAAITLFRETGVRRMEGASFGYLAMALGNATELDAAREAARAAAELLEEAAPPLLPWALAIVARIELARGALGAARNAIVLAREQLEAGRVIGEGLVRVTEVEVLIATGETGAAREALREAHARLLEGAERISNPELRKSFLENVPEHARTMELARARGLVTAHG